MMALAQFVKTNSHNCAQMTRVLQKLARPVHPTGHLMGGTGDCSVIPEEEILFFYDRSQYVYENT